MTQDQLARLIRNRLRETGQVEVDGLGVFRRTSEGEVTFVRARGIRIFIAYAAEDVEFALRLNGALEARGYRPWLDRRKLLPGQNWIRRIEDAISSSDFFLACFSTKSVRKRGGFQAEIRYALDCARRVPLDDVFVIPLRVDDCAVPRRIQRETQIVDMFPDFDAGLGRVLELIELQLRTAA